MNITNHPLVSVVVPVYNVEHYLHACLDSIRRQTYPNLEIIVVEDCSTDGSLQTLEPHLADIRLLLIQHQRNGGLSAARNTGIEAANGEYIMFVDSDDIVDHRLVEACVSSASETGAQVVTYGFMPFDDGRPINELQYEPYDLLKESKFLNDEYFRLPHFAWLKFIHTGLLRNSGIRFPVGLYYEDWPFHWHLGLVAETISQLGGSLYHYRQRRTSITGSTGHKLLDLFAVQALVMGVVDNETDVDLRLTLGNKLRDSHWSVLTRIDGALLPVALDRASAADKLMRINSFKAESNLRRILIVAIVRGPRFVSIPALRILRRALQSISPARLRMATSSSLL